MKNGALLLDIWASTTYTALSFFNKISELSYCILSAGSSLTALKAHTLLPSTVCPFCHSYGIINAIKLLHPNFFSQNGWTEKCLSVDMK
jgi:hypothetical protein